MEWMSSSLVYLWDQLTVTTVWNTGETGDINTLQKSVRKYQLSCSLRIFHVRSAKYRTVISMQLKLNYLTKVDIEYQNWSILLTSKLQDNLSQTRQIIFSNFCPRSNARTVSMLLSHFKNVLLAKWCSFLSIPKKVCCAKTEFINVRINGCFFAYKSGFLVCYSVVEGLRERAIGQGCWK